MAERYEKAHGRAVREGDLDDQAHWREAWTHVKEEREALTELRAWLRDLL